MDDDDDFTVLKLLLLLLLLLLCSCQMFLIDVFLPHQHFANLPRLIDTYLSFYQHSKQQTAKRNSRAFWKNNRQ